MPRRLRDRAARDIKHHIREEEGEMFPRIEGEDFNKDLVGAMWDRKQELMADMKPMMHAAMSKTKAGHAGRAGR